MCSDGRGAAPEMTAKSDNHFEMLNGSARPPLGTSLAPLDRHHSETIDHRPAYCRSRLAKARRATLDLQEIR